MGLRAQVSRELGNQQSPTGLASGLEDLGAPPCQPRGPIPSNGSSR